MTRLLRTQYYPDWNNRKITSPIVVNIDALLYATPHSDGTWIRYNGGDSEKGLVLSLAWQAFVEELARPTHQPEPVEAAPPSRLYGTRRQTDMAGASGRAP